MQPINIYVIPTGFCCNNEVICEVMQAYTNHLITFISDRPQVDILSLAIALDQFNADVDKLFDRVGQ